MLNSLKFLLQNNYNPKKIKIQRYQTIQATARTATCKYLNITVLSSQNSQMNSRTTTMRKDTERKILI